MNKFIQLAVCVLVSLLVLSAIVFWLSPKGIFVPESRAVHALEIQGFSKIEITHKAYLFINWRGGSEDDCVRFTAKATNPIGKEVEVYVYSGWLSKGSTIRVP